MCFASVTPPAAGVGTVGVCTRGTSPGSVAALADGVIRALDCAVAVATKRGWVWEIWFLV